MTSEQQRFGRVDAVMLLVVSIASVIAVAGFRAVLTDWWFLTAAAVGGIVAGLVVAVAWWRQLLVGESIALSTVAMVFFGAVAANGVPTVDAFRSFFDGITVGWAELLSLSPPIDSTPEIRVLPFVLAWFGATVGGELLRRTTAPALPSLGPLIALSVAVLVTAEDRTLGAIQGTAIALGALAVGVSQFRRSDRTRPDRSITDDSDASVADDGGRRRRSGVIRAGAVLLAAGLVAPALGPRLPFAEANDRFDLRDRNEPPWDPLLVSSPLVQIKSSLKAETRDATVFSVSASAPVTRWTLAVLGSYNGVVWTVGSADGRDPSAEFRPVGSQMPQPPVELLDEGQPVTASVTIEDLRGPWLPFAGTVQAIDVLDAATAAVSDDAMAEQLRVNFVTGTMALPTGVRQGVEYQIDTGIVERPDESELADLPLDQSQPIDVAIIPPPIRNLAANVVEGADAGWPQALAIQERFVTEGFYDTSPESRPGHSYFRLAEFLDDEDKIVGFEEQYAAAAATIARIAQVPTRVVVGYIVPEGRYDIDGNADVFASDISAWIEIDFGVNGWVPLDVSPDRSREPVAEETGTTVTDVAVPSPPPPPVVPPNVDVFSGEESPPDEVDDDDADDEKDDTEPAAGVAPVVIAGAIAGGLAATLLLFLLAIILWKAQRRKRRRSAAVPATRVAHAWRETLDRLHEAGAEIDDRWTPPEIVRSLPPTDDESHDPAPTLRAMAGVVQRAAYHAEPPDHDVGEQAWNYYDGVAETLRQQRSLGQRVKMRIDPRTMSRRGWPSGADDAT